MKKGFTLIETLVVIAIILVISGVTLATFYNQRSSVSAERDAENVLNYLQRARNQTISAVNNASFGVRVSSSSAVFFEGTTYTLSNSISTFDFTSGVQASSVLTDGVEQIYFQKLTGEPSATGTITFMIGNATTTSRTIIIRGTGLAEIQ